MPKKREKADFDAGRVFLVGTGIAVLMGFIFVGNWGLLQSFIAREGTAGMGPRSPTGAHAPFAAHVWTAITNTPPTPPMIHVPPMPREPLDPPQALAAELARERAPLIGYRMIDARTGVVSIPIERAMALIAQRGLPRPAPEKSP